MASAHMISRPNGRRLPVISETEDERINSVNCLLSSWEGYCNDNWLSENHEDPRCSERRVKAFLDGLAYLLLRGHSEDTLSHYKEMTRGSSEIPVSSCPDSVRACLYGNETHEAQNAAYDARPA